MDPTPDLPETVGPDPAWLDRAVARLNESRLLAGGDEPVHNIVTACGFFFRDRARTQGDERVGVEDVIIELAERLSKRGYVIAPETAEQVVHTVFNWPAKTEEPHAD